MDSDPASHAADVVPVAAAVLEAQVAAENGTGPQDVAVDICSGSDCKLENSSAASSEEARAQLASEAQHFMCGLATFQNK